MLSVGAPVSWIERRIGVHGVTSALNCESRMSQCPICNADIDVPFSASGLFACSHCGASLQSNLPPLVAGAILAWLVLASSLTAMLGVIGVVLAAIVAFVLWAAVVAVRQVRSVSLPKQ